MKSIALVEYFAAIAAAAAAAEAAAPAAATADRRGPVESLETRRRFFQTRTTSHESLSIYRSEWSGCHQGKERKEKERIAYVGYAAQGVTSLSFILDHFPFTMLLCNVDLTHHFLRLSTQFQTKNTMILPSNGTLLTPVAAIDSP